MLGGLEALGDTGIEKVGNDYRIEVPIIVLDDDSFNEYCKTIGVQNTYSSGNMPVSITINRIWDNINSNFRNRAFIPYINAEEGRILSLNPTDSIYNIPVKVVAYSTRIPNLREEYNYYSLVQIMSHSSFDIVQQDFDVSEYYKIIITPGGDFKKAANSLSHIISRKEYAYEIENRQEEEEYNKLARNGWNIVMGTLCLLFAIIGIANIFVNTLGDIHQRRRQYVRYTSIGLTHYQMIKMLLIEALLVCLKPIIIIIPIDLLFVLFANMAQYDGFINVMPIKPVVTLAFVIVLSTGIAYWLLERRIFKADILDNIKNN